MAKDFIGAGPRFVDVIQLGREVIAGRVLNQPEGVPGLKIFDRHVGTTSGLPFDRRVRDARGNEVGTLEVEFGGRLETLRRW